LTRKLGVVPKLWTETIEEHRRTVHDAILDTTAELAAEHGLLGVKMSQIAEKVGIGRATLYKYFPDVEAILIAWHHRQIAAHLERLARIRDQTVDPGRRLQVVLEAYAFINQHWVQRHQSDGHSIEFVAFLHQDLHLEAPRRQLHDMIKDLLVEAADAGRVRDDVSADELADYCLHALQAASTLSSKAAIHRLITVTLDGLRPAR
jgi:AcrR family transcriptional regulator